MSDIIPDFERYDAMGLADLVRRKEVKPIELVETVIDRIERVNPTLNCVNIKTYDIARNLAQGPLPDGPFKGYPWLLKDIAVLYSGVPMTMGSRFLKDFISPGDSEVVTRIKNAGMVLVGKTATPEFGVTCSTESVLWGVTRNPWNLDHVAGGSSGGAAVAVAARIVPMADGSDGGGSIRVPASNCGVVGLKPCRGRVPVGPFVGDFWYGGVLFNCLSQTVRDTAAYLDVVAGALPGDPYQPARPARPFLEEISRPAGRLKIGYSHKGFPEIPVDPECVNAVENAARLCKELGHEVAEMDFTFDVQAYTEFFGPIVAVSTTAGVDAFQMMVGRAPTADDFELATWELVQAGQQFSGVQHAVNIEKFRFFGRQIASLCDPFDVVITPTQPNPPLKLGSYSQTKSWAEMGAAVTASVIFTAPYNVSGQPAISLPLHWTAAGLPVGVQFAGRYAEEATLLRLAAQIEQAKPWRDRKPPVCA